MNKYNNQQSVNPKNITRARDHRPLRWVVRQYFNETDESTGEIYRAEVFTGYNNQLEKIKGMPSILSQSLNNIHRFGGELYADYGAGLIKVEI
jgi:hypothetical protein